MIHPVSISAAQMMDPSIWILDLGFNLSQYPGPVSPPSLSQPCSLSPLSLLQVKAHRQHRALPHSYSRCDWILMRTTASSMSRSSNLDSVNHWDYWFSQETSSYAALVVSSEHWRAIFPSSQHHSWGHFPAQHLCLTTLRLEFWEYFNIIPTVTRHSTATLQPHCGTWISTDFFKHCRRSLHLCIRMLHSTASDRPIFKCLYVCSWVI